MQLSEYCFNVCDVLKTAIQGRETDSLDESVVVALEDLERWADWSYSAYPPLPTNFRVTREIERTLRRGACVPRTQRDKGKVEGHKLKIQEIFDGLSAQNAPLPDTSSTTMSESGAPLIRPRRSRTEY